MRCNYLFFVLLILCSCARPPPPSPRSPELVFQALATAGVPYRRGGNSPETGFDCSGLVAHVYREAFGIQLPHNALAQSRMGRRVTLAGLEAGDLVFYNTERRPYSHVGIYLGDRRFIHAPKPGTAVRIEDMSTAYWSRRFDGARRVME
jgi:cell wall-associated NlpC family hydrolase